MPPMAACSAGFEVNPSMKGTKAETVGPYNPKDKLDFELPAGVDPIVSIDTHTITGAVIQAKKALPVGFYITSGLVYPNVDDAFIPHNLLNQFGGAAADALKKLTDMANGLEMAEGLGTLKTVSMLLLVVGVAFLALGV